MFEFLIFYYCFSVLFMIGFVDFDDIDGVGVGIVAIILMLVLAPLLFPINFGCVIHETYKWH